MLVNPILVGYDPFLGLQLGGGQPATSEYWARSTSKDRGGGESYSYIGETFDQHVGRMLDVYARDPVLEERISAIGYIVEEFCGWPPGMLDRVIRASIVLHDVGKLTPDWTRYIRQYQRAGGHGTRPWLVHTDAPKSGTRPPRWSPPKHALAGAAHTLGVGKALDQEAAVWSEARDRIDPARPSAVLFTAILTHHSPDIGSLVISASDRIEADARAVVEAALLRSNLAGAVKAATPDRPLDRLAVNYSSLGLVNSWREWVALAVVIRALRLADGWSQESNRWEVS